MTSKLNKQAASRKGKGQFPDFPPRDDMQNPLHIYVPGYLTTLSRHFGSPDTTLVFSEVPVGHRTSQRQGILIPDLIVAFDVNAQQVIEQWGFAIEDQGKPPDFVMEVASPHTYRNDIGRKRTGYQAYGVPEYWRYDGSGGRWYPQALAGDRLVDGTYQPIAIESDGGSYWGYSEALGLTVCWEEGKLRWWDSVSGQYLATHAEEADAREAKREAQRLGREELLAERQARLEAEERVRQLEEQVARLRQTDGSP